MEIGGIVDLNQTPDQVLGVLGENPLVILVFWGVVNWLKRRLKRAKEGDGAEALAVIVAFVFSIGYAVYQYVPWQDFLGQVWWYAITLIFGGKVAQKVRKAVGQSNGNGEAVGHR